MFPALLGTLILFLVALKSQCSAFLPSCPATSSFLSLKTRKFHSSNVISTFTLLLNSAQNVEREINCSWEPVNSKSKTKITSLLVCGDGDLSFCGAIAPSLQEADIELTATVLEDRETHQKVYQRSSENEENIMSCSNHKALYGVDATQLKEYFANQTFDRIQFNFPHWKGKANHRYNRQLIDAFLKSASEMISDNGEIHMALVQGQGGYNAQSLAEYKDTWTPSYFAAGHGLLLSKVKPFEAMYNLSSHRGVDRGFKIGSEPKMFIFSKAGETSIPERNQLCCRHELHILLPGDDGVNDSSNKSEQTYTINEIISCDAVQTMVQSIVPDGIRVEVPARSILTKDDTGYETDMAVFMVVYCGESRAMKRDNADNYRHLAEIEVEKHVALRENRKGRLISKPFPYHLLDSILKDNSTDGLSKTKEAVS